MSTNQKPGNLMNFQLTMIRHGKFINFCCQNDGEKKKEMRTHFTWFTRQNFRIIYPIKKMTATDNDDNNDDWIQYTNNSVISGLIEIYCKDFNPSICLKRKNWRPFHIKLKMLKPKNSSWLNNLKKILCHLTQTCTRMTFHSFFIVNCPIFK